MKIAAQVLAEFDLDLSHVYRVRWYLTDIEDQNEVGKAHFEVFSEFPPVATMLAVSALVDSDMPVELECEAYLGT